MRFFKKSPQKKRVGDMIIAEGHAFETDSGQRMATSVFQSKNLTEHE